MTAWTDPAGRVTAVVPGPRRGAHLGLRVAPVSPRARLLAMPRLVVPVA